MRRIGSVAVAVLCVWRVFGALPPPPGPDGISTPFPQWMALGDSAEAIWPMRGTEPARRLAPGAFELPVRFAGNEVERASWDFRLPLDLRVAEGVQFDFYCGDPSPFSGFSVYFKSGNGWYNVGFAPVVTGIWHRVSVSKADAFQEERVEGWGGISAIRLSGWRCGTNDTVCAIANLAPLGGNPDVVVVRAESATDRAGSEAAALKNYAGTVCTTFSALGVAYAQVADTDLSEALMERVKLVVLPYNPSVPDRVIALLKPFVARGGRLMVCYTFPAEVGELIGLRPGAYRRPPNEGRYTGFERVGKGLKGQPAFAPQASWIAHLAQRTGPGETVAVWRDADGRPTDQPAIIRTDRGVFIGHVWLGGQNGPQAQLMRALVGELIPDIAASNAKRVFAKIGRTAQSWDLLSTLPAKLPPASEAALREMQTLKEKAGARLGAGDWDEAVSLSEVASRQAERAWLLAQPVRPKEFRGFWCHSAWGLPNRDWESSIRFLKENGFNAILPNFSWGGVAFYPSEHLPVAAGVEKRGNPVEACLAACRKYGVACHIWKVCGNMGGYAPQAFVDRMVAENRTVVRFDGKRENRWLCPSDPRNRDLEIAAMIELSHLPTDGIHFDYIRYPGGDTCFCAGCRARFEERIGHAVADWPQGVRRDPELAKAWRAFRCEAITAVVRAVHDQVKKENPKMAISAAVFRNPENDPDSVAQEWARWCREGLLDFVCPMDYIDSPIFFRNMVAAQKRAVGAARIYPGIGLSCWKSPVDPVNLALQIQAVREEGVPGFTIFNFDGYGERVLPMIREGPVRE
ncbi:MAG: family 10 glycosylhydrolase [Kiritimatiellae bacterium]|nr:family 10 glycosylhydrolase [Kiritimatiellia bacterium]